MPATWPETLPQRFLIAGNQHQLADPRLSSATDTGPGKSRPRSSAVPDSFTGSMRMSGAQWAILTAFGRDDLARWSLPFTIPAPDGGDDWLVMLRQNALPSRVNIGGDRWTVTMSLLVLP